MDEIAPLTPPVVCTTSDVVEHAMRICADDAPVIALLDASAGSAVAAAAVGRVVAAARSTRTARSIHPGSPLALWVRGTGTLDMAWRDQVPVDERSLYAEMVMLEALTETGADDLSLCSYRRLEELRTRATTAR